MEWLQHDEYRAAPGGRAFPEFQMLGLDRLEPMNQRGIDYQTRNGHALPLAGDTASDFGLSLTKRCRERSDRRGNLIRLLRIDA